MTSSFGYRKALSKGYISTEKTWGPVPPLLFLMGEKGGPVRMSFLSSYTLYTDHSDSQKYLS